MKMHIPLLLRASSPSLSLVSPQNYCRPVQNPLLHLPCFVPFSPVVVETQSSSSSSQADWCLIKQFALARFTRRTVCNLQPKHHYQPAIFSRRNTRRISGVALQCRESEEEREPTYMSSSHGDDDVFSLSDHPNPEISCFYQKGFSQITRQDTGRALHALYLKSLDNLSVFIDNSLITMYSKFGRITLARYVFDGMSEKYDSSWNSMISGFVRAGCYRDSFNFFNEMRRIGVKPSGHAVSSLIAACDRSRSMFSEGVQAHNFVLKVGSLYDVYVATCLLHFYGNYGLAFDSRKLFEEMPSKNEVSWTTLMVAYSDYGDPSVVMDTYQHMRHEGVICNGNTLSTVISSCASLEDDMLGCQVVGHVIKLGLEANLSVGNSLVSMFGCAGRMREACYVFDSMDERDIISWNSIISANCRNGLCEESLRCFHRMRLSHREINSTTLSTLLTGCGSTGNLKWGRGIHSLVLKFGLDSDLCICNSLMRMYSDSGKLEDAENVFNEMIERDLISWNSILACYGQDGKCLDALRIFHEIFYVGKTANFVTFTSALAACSNPEFVTEGKTLHGLVIVTGLQENLVIGNALVTLYAKSALMVEANKVFQAMPKRDIVTWNALIGGHADNESSYEAVKAFNFMRGGGIPADYITISNILGACSAANDLLTYGMPIHAYVVLNGFESNEHVQNSLITMYGKCGDLNSSNYIFDGLSIKNAVAWNCIMAAHVHQGCLEEALKLLVKMMRTGMYLDQFSFSECLAATAKLAILEEGQQLHSLSVKLGFDSHPFVRNTTMDMYGKCGELGDVLRIIPQSVERSRLSWNVLISSYAKHDYFEKAKETFHEMVGVGVSPDHVTFVSLLSACSHGGLVEEGLAYYDSMIIEYGVPVTIGHCVCIIDLLGRSGRLAEAEAFIKKMPIPPTDYVWRSLLSACKIHGNLDLGRKAAENLLKLDPSDDSAYVLYSNVCASTGKWEDVENIRKQMGLNNIKKNPACSWVKLRNKFGSFGIGDTSHPQSSEIYAKLEELKKIIKEAGYIPDTSYALQDTDEEQKEHHLWNHSERLALAFGLINTPEGSTIKVFKNLRVCGDCHSVYKFVSGILGRKIILRDPYRFHHFSSGQCSCSDYW